MKVLRGCGRHITSHKPHSKRLLCCPVRSYAEEVNSRCLKPFDSIPGPRRIPIIGSYWKYWRPFGEYSIYHMDKRGWLQYMKYGPIVRERFFNTDIINVFNPADIQTTYSSEGRYPGRISHIAVEKYRLERPHIYNSGGLIPTNGEEWWKLRSSFQRGLSGLKDVRGMLPVTDTIMQEFIEYLVSSPPGADVLPKITRFYLELTGMIVFGTRLNSFSPEEQAPGSLCSQLIHAAVSTAGAITGLDHSNLWRLGFRTPLYRELEKSLNLIEKVAIELVNKERDGKGDGKSLIAEYLTHTDIDIKDIYGMAVDLILAGVDTTAYTTCYALYHLATNPQEQQLVYEEARTLLPSKDDVVTSETLENNSVVRRALKETLRLNPISIGIGRILQKDAVLSGYYVPSGKLIVTQNQVSCRLEKYFPRPDEFLPGRWKRESPGYRAINPYLVMPFGHKTRSCIGRRLAEQNLQVVLLKLLRQYKLNWHGGKLTTKSVLINIPEHPMPMSFTKRQD